VKEEDIDWMIYHLVAEKETTTPDDLITASAMDAGTVHASLARLEQFLLIECSGNSVRALSIGESLLKCQVKNTLDPGLEIVDGVIKVREDPHAKK
jgi:hypothetical protein